VIALLGNLTRDYFPGEQPRVGGAPFHGARALACVDVEAIVYARCAEADRAELLPPVERLGAQVTYVPGMATAEFGLVYEGDRRTMELLALGETWRPEELPELSEDVTWAHVAPLVRSDFPAETLAALARGGRRLSLDGQGLVRTSRLGTVVLDGAYDPEVLAHVTVLKLAEEEAAVLGDPAALPVAEVIVTHGSRGATVHAGGRSEHVAATPVDSDPTGAGDAFCVSYVAARSLGLDAFAAARTATATVAVVLAG
jgi:sugar/nucleoside kinase (ribokinase family)